MLCFGASLLIQEPREVKNYRQLGQFRWLNPDRAIANPAMCGVRLVQKKSADEQQQNHADGGIDDSRLPQAPVIHAHQGKHSQQAEDQPGGLPHEKVVTVPILFLGGDRGSAEDHHRAEQAQRHRHTK